MRVIAGIAKGRRLIGPPGMTTRPPTDRMREAVFSSLGPVVVGAVVLDLYAGSGSFGLEALSRGAESATFVERDRAALATLRRNVDAVALGGTIIGADVTQALTRLDTTFDLVFVDPPYATDPAALEEVLADVSRVLALDGIAMLHRRRDGVEVQSRGTLAVTRRRRYGDAEVWRYEKEEQ